MEHFPAFDPEAPMGRHFKRLLCERSVQVMVERVVSSLPVRPRDGTFLTDIVDAAQWAYKACQEIIHAPGSIWKDQEAAAEEIMRHMEIKRLRRGAAPG